MKKILIIFLGIFSLLIINGGYCLAKQDVESFSVIENKKFDNISIALLEMLNSLPEVDIKKVINEQKIVYSSIDGLHN